MILLAGGVAYAQTNGTGSAVAPVAHAMTPGDVEAFFDGVVPLQLERSDVAGASVLVMQGDTVLLEKGYGFADLKKKQAVDPAHTIFRLASISKLFTWTSVMQLAEQGKLDIDADVNKYLDFEIHPSFGKPITLRNLMTHTGGFEESNRDVIVLDPKKEPTLRDFLIRNQPERLHAPGTVPAYSNYGVGLAGYIVQRVSGEPFEKYVAEHIFGPLKMTGSTFYQPPQAGVTATPSEGYKGDTEKPAVGFEIFNPAPAGGISSTAADMSRFARALLHGGELDGVRILQAETLRQMWTPQFRTSPDMPPICMGFYEDWRNGTHWIGHEGDLIAFHSMFFIDPVSKTTLFVAYNSAGGASKPRPELIDLFTDRYFPGAPTTTDYAGDKVALKAIVGTYDSTRRADSNRTRLMAVVGEEVASIDKDGLLHLTGAKDLRGHPIKWRAIGKDLWQEVDGQRRLFAVRDESGKVVRIAGMFPGVQGERVPWWDTGKFVWNALGLSLLILALAVLAPLVRVLRRLIFRHRTRVQPQPGTVYLPLMTKVAALVWIIPVGALIALLASESDAQLPPTSAWDKWFILGNVVIGLALLLSLFPLRSAWKAWHSPDLRWITKVKFSLVAASFVMLAWIAVHFHLIGPVQI
jgi:CubicO group peptidase (beta-lactamase class C family)